MNPGKAQGSLEYLLLIGGAVVVGSIVIVLMLGASQSGSSQVQAGINAAQDKEAALGFAGNLVVNPGFENGSTGWQLYNPGVTIGNYSCQDGSSCVQAIAPNPEPSNTWSGVMQGVSSLSPNTNYTASAWVKGTCTLGLWNTVNWSGPNWVTASGPNDGSWHRVQVINTTSSNGTLYFYLMVSQGTTGWCDLAYLKAS